MLAVNRRLALGALLALAALCALASWAGSAAPATAAPATVLPPIRHVWVINLENTSYGQTFGDTGNFFTAKVPPHPYLKDVLQRMSNGYSMSRLDDLLPWNWTASNAAA